MLGEHSGKTEPAAGWQRSFTVRAGGQIATRNQASNDVLVLCTGWAFRYFQLADGRRQILQFLMAGDILSPATIFDKKYLYSAKALTEVMLSEFPRAQVRQRCASRPEAQSAIANCSVDEVRDAIELATTLGQCSAEERIAHLLLRLMPRIAARNVIREHRYPFPLRQQHVADAVGLTPVHVSRVFSLLRERGIMSISEGVLRVFDMSELERLAPQALLPSERMASSTLRKV
jgi:CRP-like cAMP-binding protein